MSQKVLDEIRPLVEEHLKTARRPLIVIIGPTAGGKTDMSVELALDLGARHIDSWTDAEIINADSRQLYRHLDIGTAKVTLAERRGVVHHLLDVLDPKEEVTASFYQEKATEAIDAILSRNHLPILVGGSMLYISAVIDGLQFVGKSDPAVREKLSEEYDVDEGITLHKRLEELDPEAAENIPRQNKVYLLRAMEIARQHGSVNQPKRKTASPYDTLIIGLEWPADVLRQRIEKRTEQLIKNGWIDEVKTLIEKGYSSNDPGMISHGYREIMEWMDSGSPDTAELTRKIIAKTCQYAKRQRTWWRGDERIKWIKMT